MKLHNIKSAILAVLSLCFVTACQNELEEIDSIRLGRCLQPMNLKAKVSDLTGDQVTFSWDVTKDADHYLLEVYTDKEMTTVEHDVKLLPSEVPYTVKLAADSEYWFRVRAVNEELGPDFDSKWANGEKSVKTFAVKDNLFLKVADLGCNAVTVNWSKEVADYMETSHLTVAVAGDEDNAVEVKLGESDIQDATKVIEGLDPSTNYVITLYYLSARRGQVDVWTLADPSGLVKVSDLEALKAQLALGSNILLSMDGSPYDLGACDVANGVHVSGESSADGTLPVIKGEFHFADAWVAGSSVLFEGVELNGNDGQYGFPVQKKNGGTADQVEIGSIVFRNCVIRGYSKGLIYEWSKTMSVGELTWDSCDINNINPDGSQGGDVIDFRGASTVSKMNIVNNTIYQGMRTFVRIDAGTWGDIKFENNTLMNLCFVDNTNNAGIFGLQVVPANFSFKNNLFLNFEGKSTLTGANSKYKTADDLSVASANNWFYNVHDAFFTDNFPKAKAGYNALDTDPCFNAKGGWFNLTNSDLVAAKVGASKWWTPYVEEPEDLTWILVDGAHSWNFGDAKYFSSDFKRFKVRDALLVAGSEEFPVCVKEGELAFGAASVLNKKGVPQVGYVAFMVDKPGSVVIKPSDAAALGKHFVVAVGDKAGTSVRIKGGAAALADMGNAQKILISDIAEESIVYVYCSGAIELAKLAWSEDISPVNTALPAPVPEAEPSSFTAGEATDVVVTWPAVANADNYSVVFKGKTFAAVQDEATGAWSYTVEGKTTGMLEAGSYKVEVYANPGADDIYNTQSSVGTATFAVLPKAGQEDDKELVVKTTDELLAAIDAGKTEITLAPGDYAVGNLSVISSIALKGQDGANVTGAITPSGELTTLSFENIHFIAGGEGVFINLPEAGVTAAEIKVKDCVIDGYSKSVLYGNYDTANIDKLSFIGNIVKNHGTGQGVYDLRKGVYGSIVLFGNTFIGGRDFIRADSSCTIGELKINNNTFDGNNLGVNSNGILYVRASCAYEVNNNLFINEIAEGKTVILTKASGVSVPSMKNNFYWNIDATNFFAGLVTEEIGTANGGVVYPGEVSPVRDSASGDYTLVSGLAISNKVGAPMWNPNWLAPASDSFTVKNTEEFLAALDAGKTSLVLAAEGSPYVLETPLAAVPGLRVKGEGNPVIQGCVTVGGETNLGELVFEGLTFQTSTEGVAINVASAATVSKLVVRNCVFDGFSKSVFYDNLGLTASAVKFSGIVVKNQGTGQGIFDLRKSSIGSFSIEQSTITGGRDLVRADANTVVNNFEFNNNTVDKSNLGLNGNAIMYVRATPAAYSFKNNLFLNEVAEGKTVLLSKASGVTVPTAASNNFFFNYDETNFFSGLFTKEIVGAVTLPADPCKDAASGDYTLVDALCLSSNVGAARWNANAGRVSTGITVSNVEELLTAIDAGKTSVTLKYGRYDLTAVTDNAAVSGGVLTLTAPLTLKGEKKAGKAPEIVGGIKFGEGMTGFTAQSLVFSGNEKAIGTAFEIAASINADRILVRDCEVAAYNKSLFYGNAVGTIGALTFDKLIVRDFGTGQGVIDVRKELYSAIVISNSTFYNGGRDFIRLDAGKAKSLAIRNNTFSAVSIDAANSILYVRAEMPGQYIVENNLFLNETGSTTILAKAGTQVPVMKNNFFFNCSSAAFWTGTITKDLAVGEGIGTELDTDPCTKSDEFNFKLTSAVVRAAKAGDPRWL